MIKFRRISLVLALVAWIFSAWPASAAPDRDAPASFSRQASPAPQPAIEASGSAKQISVAPRGDLSLVSGDLSAPVRQRLALWPLAAESLCSSWQTLQWQQVRLQI